MANPLTEVLTTAEAGALWGLQPDTIKRAALDGRLQSRKSGGTWLTTRAAMRELYGEMPMNLETILDYARENARDVADLAAIDRIEKLEADDPYRKVLVREIRRRYEDEAAEADRESVFDD